MASECHATAVQIRAYAWTVRPYRGVSHATMMDAYNVNQECIFTKKTLFQGLSAYLAVISAWNASMIMGSSCLSVANVTTRISSD